MKVYLTEIPIEQIIKTQVVIVEKWPMPSNVITLSRIHLWHKSYLWLMWLSFNSTSFCGSPLCSNLSHVKFYLLSITQKQRWKSDCLLATFSLLIWDQGTDYKIGGQMLNFRAWCISRPDLGQKPWPELTIKRTCSHHRSPLNCKVSKHQKHTCYKFQNSLKW